MTQYEMASRLADILTMAGQDVALSSSHILYVALPDEQELRIVVNRDGTATIDRKRPTREVPIAVIDLIGDAMHALREEAWAIKS